MKKNFLTKTTFLALAFLCVGTGSVWGEATTIYERALTGDNAWAATDITKTAGTIDAWYSTTGFTNDATNGLYCAAAKGSRSAVLTFTHTANSIQTIDLVFSNLGNTGSSNDYSYLKIGSAIEIQSNQQDQKGSVIINGTSSAITDCNIKNYNRGGDLWTIHVEINTATNTVTALTLLGNSTSAKNAHFTLSKATSLGAATYNTITIGTNRSKGSPAVALNSIKIQEEEQTIETANYTVKYKCGDTEVKTAVTRTGAVNSAIALTAADKADFTLADNSKKYIYVSDDSEGKTISGDGTSVVTVTFREAATYNWSAATNVGDLDLGSGTCFEGDNVSVSYPLYVNVDGTLYTKAATNQTYAASFTPDADNYVYTAVYTATGITNVVYFSEAENIVGATATSAGDNMTARSSNQKCAYAESDITLINLPTGVYKATSVQYANSSAGLILNYQVGDQTFANTMTAASNWYGFANEFALPAAADFKWLTSGSAKNGLDFIYIQKIGEVSDLSYTKDLSATGFASFSAPVNVTVPDGTYAYKAAIGENKVILTKVEGVIPANTGVILYNPSQPTEDITLNGTVDAGAEYTGNELIATSIVANRTVNGSTDASSYTYYALNADAASFGQITADITLSDNKAYLKVDAAQPTATALTIAFGDDATGIESAIVDADAENNVIYNVYGIRVDENYKGLVIVNGKKYLKK